MGRNSTGKRRGTHTRTYLDGRCPDTAIKSTLQRQSDLLIRFTGNKNARFKKDHQRRNTRAKPWKPLTDQLNVSLLQNNDLMSPTRIPHTSMRAENFKTWHAQKRKKSFVLVVVCSNQCLDYWYGST